MFTDGFELDIDGNLDLNGTINAATGTDGGTVINIAGNWDMTSGMFINTGSTVAFDSASTDQTITSAGLSFNSIVINNTGTPPNDDIVLVDALDVNGTISIVDGDLDANTNDQNISVGGNWIVGGSGSFDAGTSTVYL